MDKRVIPAKNYVIFVLIALISFLLVYNLAKWYKELKANNENVSIMTTVVSEVLETDIKSHIIENPNTVLYLSSSHDQTIKSFEDDLKELIIEDNLRNKVIYMDISKITDDNFLKEFRDSYFNSELKEDNVKLDVFPNVLIIKEYKVTSILYPQQESIRIDDVKQFLTVNEVIEQ